MKLVHISGCAVKSHHSKYTGVHASIVVVAINLRAHSAVLRVSPLHASSEKYSFVPGVRSTRETNSNASGFVESAVMITISHVWRTVQLPADHSIQYTLAVVLHVFPYSSWKVKVKSPLPVNVYHADHQLLSMMTPVLLKVIVAVTLPVVGVIGSYVILHTGICITLNTHELVQYAVTAFPVRFAGLEISSRNELLDKFVFVHRYWLFLYGKETTVVPEVSVDGMFELLELFITQPVHAPDRPIP